MYKTSTLLWDSLAKWCLNASLARSNFFKLRRPKCLTGISTVLLDMVCWEDCVIICFGEWPTDIYSFIWERLLFCSSIFQTDPKGNSSSAHKHHSAMFSVQSSTVSQLGCEDPSLGTATSTSFIALAWILSARCKSKNLYNPSNQGSSTTIYKI